MKQKAEFDPSPSDKAALRDPVVVVLIVSCISLNFILAVFNNLVTAINSRHLIILQMAATVCAIIIAFTRGPRVSKVYPLASCLCLTFFLLSSLFRQNLNIKALYDIFIIPIFILLGSTVNRLSIRLLHVMLAVIFGTAVLEILLTENYISVVNPMKYYMNTRSWIVEGLGPDSNTESGLYVGTLRPGGSALGGSELGHRAGSVFLEPLSLGYFACVLAIAYMHFYRAYPLKKACAAGVCGALALLADTRVALAVVVAVYLTEPIVHRIPRLLGVFVPILVMSAGAVIYNVATIDEYDSDIGLRVSWTFEALQDASLLELTFGGLDMTHANDSGIIYIANYVGFAGLFLTLFLCSGMLSSLGNNSFISHAALFYMTVTAMFGAAFLSIKTAALLGAIVGASGAGAFPALPRGHLGPPP